MTLNYSTAQKDIEEHTLAMNNLIELCNYNTECFESLQNKHACECTTSSQLGCGSSACQAPSVQESSQSYTTTNLNNILTYNNTLCTAMNLVGI